LVIKSGNFKEPNPQSGSFISGDLPFGGGYFAKGKWKENNLPINIVTQISNTLSSELLEVAVLCEGNERLNETPNETLYARKRNLTTSVYFFLWTWCSLLMVE
jgi:hypothetical protein